MTACRSRTPTTVTATTMRRPAVGQTVPILPAHHHPQTPAVTMIQAGPTTAPAMTIRRTATARTRAPTPRRAAILPAPARSWTRPPIAGRAAEGPSPSEVAAEEQAWDEAMHQAASLAKAQGKLPGAVEETVRGAHGSTVDWRTLLRRYMTDASKSDYSWSLPNRRFIDSGLYLPSIRSEGIDTIAVIVDTSGSLPAGTLAEFWAEVREVASELQPERVILLQVDAAVQDAAEYAAADLPDEIAIKGRGGTDFRPGFAWLEEHDIRPGVCLYLTDMLCSSYPETAPPFDVIWCNWSAPPGGWNREPWGERIDIGTSSGAAP